MLFKIKEYLNKLPSRLLNGDKQKKIIKSYSYIVLGIVSLFMTIVNGLTGEIPLGIATLIFGLLCIFSLILHVYFERMNKVTDAIFGVSVICLFTFFIVFGYPQGFSIIWIALMAPIALLFYGIKKGSYLTLSMFLILIFFMWTSLGNSLLKEEATYSETFKLRFPFLCIGSYALSLALELIKELGFKELSRVNEINKELSRHDPLTGLYNRTGMRDEDEKYRSLHENFKKGYFQIIDIDKFKEINDEYGHIAGDIVLKEIAKIMSQNMPGIICRYGGDEFALLTLDFEYDLNKIENVVKMIEKHDFIYSGQIIKATISIGVYEATKEETNSSDECLRKADIALYQSKENGRNRVSIYKEK